jgi:RNA polymerase sigma-70 factor (ECF subfamily)
MARYFANKVANPADAEELVGATFERIAKTLGSFQGRGTVRAYMFGVAFNVLREYLSRHRRLDDAVELDTVAIADILPSPTRQMSLRRRERALLEALRSLPLSTQIVLELHLFEQMGRSEIAALLGLPRGTIASRLRRGRAQLDERLAEIGPGVDLHTTSRGLRDWMSSVRRVAGKPQ